MKSNKSWVGFDLDGTLAKYEGWKGPESIGEPIAPMIDLVKDYLAAGTEVRIVTARASAWECEQLHLFDLEDVRRDQNMIALLSNSELYPMQIRYRGETMLRDRLYNRDILPIERWCEEHIGQKLRITAIKDFLMVKLYDDRAVGVVTNTGQLITQEEGSWVADSEVRQVADDMWAGVWLHCGLWEWALFSKNPMTLGESEEPDSAWMMGSDRESDDADDHPFDSQEKAREKALKVASEMQEAKEEL